uniref:CCHC-type domain-containing protein n=1 Tax=Hucho hucho TaxID=62062 RepID=A0A4W5KIH9_9TELE
MTRWARANNVHKHKPAEATPWRQEVDIAVGSRGAEGAAEPPEKSEMKPGYGLMGRDICYCCECPYAKSFICSKTGHMSRSCPDNPKGLYATDKDCPEHQAASNQVTLGWLFNNTSADHEEVHMPVKKLPLKQAEGSGLLTCLSTQRTHQIGQD